jgi:hypothetical protein
MKNIHEFLIYSHFKFSLDFIFVQILFRFYEIKFETKVQILRIFIFKVLNFNNIKILQNHKKKNNRRNGKRKKE